MKPVNEVNHN